MVRKDTNKQYSLRKLKTGTASVAVALSVLGAGLAVNQTEVSAKAVTRSTASDPEKARQTINEYEVKNHKLTQDNERLAQEKKGLTQNNERLTQDNERLTREYDRLTQENRGLTQDKDELSKQKETLGLALEKTIEEKIKSDNDHKKEIGELKGSNKISDASRKGLRRDLDASREAKKQVEKDLANLTAELDKVKEEKQVSDASRQGLRRDLDASREAKKQVEKALEEANSKLAALEKLNKELEESKKLTEKEKAELQAKLEAEAKALKEQLAKQAEELAKLRAGKASDSQTPDAKPGNKAVPGKGQAPQAGTKPNQNKAPMKETKRQLPSTGEAANPFFTAAALTVMATAGVAAVVKRKEEN